MSSVNKVILIGRLGKDPEIKQVGEAKVANFSLATSEKYTDKSGQKVEQTEWHNIVMWRGLAELAEKYLTKGSQIYVEGKIKTRSWDDKDGNKRYITEIAADQMTFLGSKSATTDQAAAPAPVGTHAPVDVPGEIGDDLPF
jgi:single-strand DNA-binding protein